jgi:MFS family permease
LADRAGRLRVLALAAVLLTAAAVLCTLAGQRIGFLGTGLVLLGLGWSAALVGGSTLVTESLPQAVRPGAQGIVDMVMNLAGAAGGIIAGLVVGSTSFATLGVVVAVGVAPYLVTVTVAALKPSPHRARS